MASSQEFTDNPYPHSNILKFYFKSFYLALEFHKL